MQSSRSGRVMSELTVNEKAVGLPARLRGPDALCTCIILVAGLLAAIVGAWNATLIFDDPFLYEHFSTLLSEQGVIGALTVLVTNFDLYVGAPEYRTYGLSKVFHFFLWLVFGAHPGWYSAFMGLAQAGAGLFLYRIVIGVTADRVQGLLMSVVWVMSPFLVTTCFHHYSYLILPVQLALVLTWLLQKRIVAGRRLTPLAALALGVAGIILALTGELHFALVATLLVVVLTSTRSTLCIRDRLAHLVPLFGTWILAVAVHRQIWVANLTHTGPHRFNFSPADGAGLLGRTFDFFASVYPGLSVQVGQILTFDKFAMPAFYASLAIAFGLLYWVVKSLGDHFPSGDDLPRQQRQIWWFTACVALIVASLAIVWLRAAFFSGVGPILPRRYGYVPYTVFFMLVVALLSGRSVRGLVGRWPSLVVSGVLVALWAVLHFVCIAQVRAEDATVWAKVREAVAGKTDPSVLFVGSLAGPPVIGFGSPGLRGDSFPQLFESPFSKNGWQVQYARTALRVIGGGDAFKPGPAGSVILTGGLSGIHFVMGPPLSAAEKSVVVVLNDEYEVRDWRDGLKHVRVLSWQSFAETAAYVQTRVNVGWDMLLSQIYNEDATDVAIDLGAKAAGEQGTLPDAAYGAAPPNTVLAAYGLESGDDSTYSPNKKNGIPLSYMTTNRHGAFTYRLDFKNRSPKVVYVDLLDVWSDRPGARVMRVQIALDERWIDLGRFDTYSIAKKAPLSIKFSVPAVQTLRLRLTKDASSADIPFANGIRIKEIVTERQ